MQRSERDARGWNWLDVTLLAVVGILAVVTRMRQLGTESLWLDEATTFERARLPLDALIANTVDKMHVPTYFVFMHYFVRFGDDEWMLRFPSALFGILKVPLVAAAGCILGGPRAGAAAGLLLVMSLPHLRYDQEARMYAMQTFGTCLALLGQVWLFAHPRAAVAALPRLSGGVAGAGAVEARHARLAWLTWILGCLVALYMHNTSALFLVTSSCATLVLLATQREVRLGFFLHWVVANLIVLALWLPWLPHLVGQVESPRFAHRAWGEIPDFGHFWEETAFQILLARTKLHIHALVLAFAGLGVWAMRKRLALAGALLLMALLAPGLVGLVSLIKPMFLPRILLSAGPPFFVLAGQGVTALRKPWLQVLAMALLAVVGLRFFEAKYYEFFVKPDWRGIAEELSHHSDSSTLVLTRSFQEERVLGYYAERSTDPFHLPRVLRSDSASTRRLSPEKLLSGATQVFYVRDTDVEMPAAVKAIAARAERVSSVKYKGATLDRYRLR